MYVVWKTLSPRTRNLIFFVDNNKLAQRDVQKATWPFWKGRTTGNVYKQSKKKLSRSIGYPDDVNLMVRSAAESGRANVTTPMGNNTLLVVISEDQHHII